MNLQLARNIPSVGDYSMNRNIEFFGYFLIYVIFCVPVRYDAIGKRVETCHMEGLDKEFVIIICNLRELTVIFDDSQGIEGTRFIILLIYIAVVSPSRLEFVAIITSSTSF